MITNIIEIILRILWISQLKFCEFCIIGIPLDAGQVVTISITATAASIGAAGINISRKIWIHSHETSLLISRYSLSRIGYYGNGFTNCRFTNIWHWSFIGNWLVIRQVKLLNRIAQLKAKVWSEKTDSNLDSYKFFISLPILMCNIIFEG